jgi:hypothetical protein
MVYVHVASGAQHKPLPGAYHPAVDEPQPRAVSCAFAGTLDLAHSGSERCPIDCPFPDAYPPPNSGQCCLAEWQVRLMSLSS